MIVIRNPKSGDCLDAGLTINPTRLEIAEGTREVTDSTQTSFGFVVSGRAEVRTPRLDLMAPAGTYFCVPGEFKLNARGLVVLICRYGYRGLLAAGCLENVGRLSYIDGCSSTILVSPPRMGDPVFNHLHIPQSVAQSPHTHPSIRLGIVARGGGIARGRTEVNAGEWAESLTAGCVFLLHAQEVHSFHTTESPSGMDVLTYHPDSDWGPTDGEHPMLTKTHLCRKS